MLNIDNLELIATSIASRQKAAFEFQAATQAARKLKDPLKAMAKVSVGEADGPWNSKKEIISTDESLPLSVILKDVIKPKKGMTGKEMLGIHVGNLFGQKMNDLGNRFKQVYIPSAKVRAYGSSAKGQIKDPRMVQKLEQFESL